jgi:uncharacterized protein
MSSTSGIRGRFLWFDLMTTDQPAAQAFYTSLAGWGTEVWNGMGMPYHMWTSNGATLGGMMPLPPEQAAQGVPPHWLGYIGTPDVDATAALAPSIGGTVLMPPTEIPTVGKFAILQDPFGATFAAFTPAAEPPGHEGMANVGEFSWFELATKDLDQALAFYGQLFGWTLDSDMDMGPLGTYRVFSRDGQMYGGMYVIQEAMPMPPSWAYYIRVDDIDAAAARVSAGGGTIVQPPTDIPGGKVLMATDPQGGFFAAHWVGE